MTNDLKNKLCLKHILVALIVLLIAGYSCLKFKNYMAGPNITLYSPADGASLSKELVSIEGKAERISEIYLNGRKIYTDEEGNFNESLLLANGFNLFEIRAEDQFGRETVKKLQVVYEHLN